MTNEQSTTLRLVMPQIVAARAPPSRSGTAPKKTRATISAIAKAVKGSQAGCQPRCANRSTAKEHSRLYCHVPHRA
ncbi:hypothetical protein [Nitrobacter sp. 62-23]|uniref:hypothetical protein n=1 Tax=Nitrobacter sp. 62-23 TaxID=1895798 RepID=UPI000929D43F|nr:hypothetical protein [Nitrobacter sp. 62-23]OJV01714.1 MAG: hypothetical protein BGO16_09150 [Nitrobacter sp. 62-23]